VFVPVHSQDLDFHTTCLCLSTARTWVSTLHLCACPQPGPGFPHYIFEIQVLAVDRHKNVVWKSRSWLWTGMFVPGHSQDMDFHTTFLCLSTARTWISTLNCCACPQPGPGFLHYIFVPVHSQDLDFQDRHKHLVWKSRSWLWIGTTM
jgi:hypothetical protein